MGGYYVPNIQRPGFGYKRRGDNDEEWGDDSLQGGVFSSGMDWKSSQQPDMMAGDNSAPTSRGGADTDDPAVPTPDYWPSGMSWNNNYEPLGGNPPSANKNPAARIEPDAPIPGVGIPPTTSAPARVPPPVPSNATTYQPYKPGVEQQALKDMIKKGPKRSILGTIAAAAAGAGAGWVNAAGRTHVPVPTQAMRNMTWRAPGGGAWDTKLGQQSQLAQIEQGEDQRKMATEQMQAQAEERKAQAEYYKQHGVYLGQEAETHRMAEADRQKQQELQRIIAMGGRTPQVRYFPAGQTPPEVSESNDWFVRTDPGDGRYKIAVRPDPGEKIDDDTAELLGIAKGSVVPPSVIAGAARTRVAQANAAQASSDREANRLRLEKNDANTVRHEKKMEGLADDAAADRDTARELQHKERQDKALQGLEDTKRNLLIAADAYGDSERNKKLTALGYVPEADEKRIAAEVLARKQSIHNTYGQGIRQHGGAAWDVRVDEQGRVIPTTEGYLKGQKPVPLPGEEQPLIPAPPASGAAAPQGGRGGQAGAGGGRGSVPPPVAAAKTIPKAAVEKYARENNLSYDAAAQVFTGRKFKIQ